MRTVAVLVTRWILGEVLRPRRSSSARSGWLVSIPLSMTATRTPLPVNPAFHATGAPIWTALRSRLSRRVPLSQIVAYEDCSWGIPPLPDDCLPPGRRGLLGNRDCRAMHARQLADHGYSGNLRTWRRALVLHDQRQRRMPGVVIAVLQQRRHVEQPLVEPASGDECGRIAGDHLDPAALRATRNGIEPRPAAGVISGPPLSRTSTRSPVINVTEP